MLDIERRIPDNLGGTETIFENAPIVGRVEITDGIIAFGPSLIGLMIMNSFIPASYSWIGLTISGLLAFLGFIFLLAKPKHHSLSEWIKNYKSYKSRPQEIQKQIKTDGGLDENGIPLTDNPDTREQTMIQAIHPSAGAIERTDGDMVGMVELGGINLDTARDTEWRNAADSLANFFNTQCEYDVQFFLPMRQFDPSDYEEMYRERMSDEESQNNPLLYEYLDDRSAWMNGLAQESFIRQYFVIVSVSKTDVMSDQLSSGGFTDNLRNSPGGDVIADIIDGLQGQDSKSVLSDSELKERQIKELKRRLDEIKTGLSQGGTNNSEIVTGDQLGVYLKEYWEGTSIQSSEADGFVRNRPFVDSSGTVSDSVSQGDSE